MIELPDLGAVYVEVLDMTQPMLDANFIILGEQGEEILRLSLDSALSITEVTQAFMEWAEGLSKENIH
jgi:hypothetical protein